MKLDANGKILTIAKSDSVRKLLSYTMDLMDTVDEEELGAYLVNSLDYDIADLFSVMNMIQDGDNHALVEYINIFVLQINAARRVKNSTEKIQSEWKN